VTGRRAARPPAPISLAIQGRARFAERPEPLPTDRTLRRWVDQSLAPRSRAQPVELTVRFVDAREGRRLNREFRGRDYATNVLTFDYSRAPLAADIVLCVPVIEREARAQGKRLRAHLAHLVVHGTLHAQGHDHLTDRQAAAMEALETRVLASLGYPDPYRPGADAAPARSASTRRAPNRKRSKPES
jgi:probable rRNA maturation factor